MGSINTDPYHRPSHRANHLRELDGFTYPDGARIHRGDGVIADGEPARIMAFDPNRLMVQVRGASGTRWVRSEDVVRQ
jgi:hypothetical protein